MSTTDPERSFFWELVLELGDPFSQYTSPEPVSPPPVTPAVQTVELARIELCGFEYSGPDGKLVRCIQPKGHERTHPEASGLS